MPFAVAAGIGAVGAIGGALISSNASESAAQTQANAANAATAAEQAQFNTTTQNLSPFVGTGQIALGQLGSMLGLPSTVGGQANPNAPLAQPFTAAQYQQSPGYQFQLNQGLGAVQNSAAAQGGLAGGNTLTALTQYGQGLANTDYQQAYNNYTANQLQQFNMLNTVSGNGQNAAAQLGTTGAQVASNIGSNTIGAGNALAAGQVGSANALTGGINSATSNGMLSFLLAANQANNQVNNNGFSF
jgi:hypothetical protein